MKIGNSKVINKCKYTEHLLIPSVVKTFLANLSNFTRIILFFLNCLKSKHKMYYKNTKHSSEVFDKAVFEFLNISD